MRDGPMYIVHQLLVFQPLLSRYNQPEKSGNTKFYI